MQREIANPLLSFPKFPSLATVRDIASSFCVQHLMAMSSLTQGRPFLKAPIRTLTDEEVKRNQCLPR